MARHIRGRRLLSRSCSQTVVLQASCWARYITVTHVENEPCNPGDGNLRYTRCRNFEEGSVGRRLTPRTAAFWARGKDLSWQRARAPGSRTEISPGGRRPSSLGDPPGGAEAGGLLPVSARPRPRPGGGA